MLCVTFTSTVRKHAVTVADRKIYLGFWSCVINFFEMLRKTGKHIFLGIATALFAVFQLTGELCLVKCY